MGAGAGANLDLDSEAGRRRSRARRRRRVPAKRAPRRRRAVPRRVKISSSSSSSSSSSRRLPRRSTAATTTIPPIRPGGTTAPTREGRGKARARARPWQLERWRGSVESDSRPTSPLRSISIMPPRGPNRRAPNWNWTTTWTTTETTVIILEMAAANRFSRPASIDRSAEDPRRGNGGPCTRRGLRRTMIYPTSRSCIKNSGRTRGRCSSWFCTTPSPSPSIRTMSW
mmetsp:Transcript_16029/g.46109  ORF Transcript_16029/g.46109 Transcript_16029/m.46109 type:complete len:227 (+) Transcript_16029:574-1254(+)